MLGCTLCKARVMLRRRWRRRWWWLLLLQLLLHGESGAAAERDGGRHGARERERLRLLQICCCCCCCSHCCCCRRFGSKLANGSMLASESLKLSFVPRSHRGLLLLEGIHALLHRFRLRADCCQDALLERGRWVG